MIYIIHRKHVFDGGSRQSWNAVSAYSNVYRTGILEMEWSKDFRYKKEAVAWCKEQGLPWMTEKEWDAEWLKALDEGFDAARPDEDPYAKTAEILNLKWFGKVERGVRLMNDNYLVVGSYGLNAIEKTAVEDMPQILVCDIDFDIDANDLLSAVESRIRNNKDVSLFLGVSSKQFLEMSESERIDFLADKIHSLSNRAVMEFMNLPDSLTVATFRQSTMEELKKDGYSDDLCDWLSDEFGFLINGFHAEVIEKVEPRDYPLDGLRRALERFDGETGVPGVCGHWSVHCKDHQNPRFDATIDNICFDEKIVAYCNWENKGVPDKEFIAVNRVHGGDLSDKTYLSIVDLMKSVCPGHPYQIPAFEQRKIDDKPVSR